MYSNDMSGDNEMIMMIVHLCSFQMCSDRLWCVYCLQRISCQVITQQLMNWDRNG